ncbi:Ger(x)C family spore germination protein [Neobacillus ginsengisoli]|uniref:Spore germination protein KC n=1 Tax=Neobacillus ginsengisoli TaxID=904295 RepID=A0ABT9XVM9_9BACI|nr:Ger(x)C family spore germination protein [Neobacillus ginsengisoli]MDQ0199625.1 spore germination protein KC [Neobacillus ginsengisoli]
MKKCLLGMMIAVLFLPILSACWNQKELTDLAFIMAMGIDKGKTKKFDVSFQIVNPGNVSAGQTGGGQGLPIAVFKSSGDTITEAARLTTKKVSRRLYYAHTNLLVISEEIAKKDMLKIFDSLERDPEFRTTTEVVISRDTKAEEVVSSLSLLDKLPVNKITKEIKTTENMLGENLSVNIDDFISGVISTGKESVLSGYMMKGKISESKNASFLQKTVTDAVLEADGLAVFRNGKLTGWIDHEKARGVVWILNKVKGTDINVSWNGKKNVLNFVTIRSKTKVSANVKNGKPIINILIADEGWLSEANTAIDLTDPDIIEKIDKVVEKEIKKQVVSSIKAAQKQKSDIFGFGERVHRADPKLWKKIKGNWDNEFASLQVNVKVDSYTRREGVRTKPFWSNINK